MTWTTVNAEKALTGGRGVGVVVSLLARYPEDPSLTPRWQTKTFFNICSARKDENKTEKQTHLLKKKHLNQRKASL